MRRNGKSVYIENVLICDLIFRLGKYQTNYTDEDTMTEEIVERVTNYINHEMVSTVETLLFYIFQFFLICNIFFLKFLVICNKYIYILL